MSNLLHVRLGSFFKWCTKPQIGKIKLSPMLGIDKPFADAKRRELPWFKGTAADNAIKTLWAAADKLGGVDGRYLKVLLLTGKRPGALAKMRRWWTAACSGTPPKATGTSDCIRCRYRS